MKILALTDSRAPWHSFWIRFGQYISNLSYIIEVIDDPKAINDLNEGDKVFFYRFNENWKNLEETLGLAKNRGVKIISDIDDYIWQAKGWNKNRLKGFTRSLKKCDVITCSTNYLRLQLIAMFNDISIVTIPNTAPSIKKECIRRKIDGFTRIGWTGAPWTRPKDIEILLELSQWIKFNANLKLKFVHIGHHEGYLSFANILNLPKGLIETYPLQSHNEYLNNLFFDIGLAPLEKNIFNQFKSSIKILEYSNMEIPWIASNELPYNETCKEWGWNGRLCEKPESWIEQIKPLLNQDRRKKEGEKLFKLCQLNSSFNSGVARWEKLLSINT